MGPKTLDFIARTRVLKVLTAIVLGLAWLVGRLPKRRR